MLPWSISRIRQKCIPGRGTQLRKTWLKTAHRAGDELTGCDPTVRKSLRPKGRISLRKQRSHAEGWPVLMCVKESCFGNHAVWHLKQADQSGERWRHTGLQLTSNYCANFRSLCLLMRANISYILLYDLLVFTWSGQRDATLRQHSSWHERVCFFHLPTIHHPAERLMSALLIRKHAHIDDHMVEVKGWEIQSISSQ